MAMFATVAFYVYPHAGFRWKWPRVFLVLCVFGALSTSGFGIFVVTFAVAVLIAHRRRGLALLTQRAIGLALVGLGSWLALEAPVFGVMTKENVISTDERGAATGVGLDSLQSFNLGGGSSESAIPNVNLIAAIGGLGLLFSLMVVMAVLLPFVGGPFWKSRRWAVAPAFAAIFSTFLFAQPANSSAYAFVCVAVVAAAGANVPAGGIASRIPRSLAEEPSGSAHLRDLSGSAAFQP
jgi:hypothetical protein